VRALFHAFGSKQQSQSCFKARRGGAACLGPDVPLEGGINDIIEAAHSVTGLNLARRILSDRVKRLYNDIGSFPS